MSGGLRLDLPLSEDASNYLVVAALASPHVLYAFIWYFPHIWRKQFGKKGVEVFETCAWLLKVVQFSSAIAWFAVRKPTGIDIFQIPPLAALMGVALIAGGQTLNAGIYKAIGHVGVYYGFKLGHKVPWVDGFPFNVVQHPQYVGSVMSVWGVVALVWTQSPIGIAMLAGYWTCLYILTAIQESS